MATMTEPKTVNFYSCYPGAVFTIQVKMAEANELLSSGELSEIEADKLRTTIQQYEEKKKAWVPFNVEFRQFKAQLPTRFIPVAKKRSGYATEWIIEDDFRKMFDDNPAIFGQWMEKIRDNAIHAGFDEKSAKTIPAQIQKGLLRNEIEKGIRGEIEAKMRAEMEAEKRAAQAVRK